MTTQVYAGVREILAGPDWEPVAVTDHGAFFTIAGMFKGTAHSGSRKDWRSLAADLDRIARELEARLAEELAEKVEAEPAPEPVAVVEPEPEPAPIEPEPDPSADLLQELDALKDENAELKAELERLRNVPAPAPEPPTWVDTAAEQEVKTDDLLDLMRADPVSAEDVVQKFSKLGRKKFTELLNVELAELQQERGGPRENLAREAECERLLDLFARVGSM